MTSGAAVGTTGANGRASLLVPANSRPEIRVAAADFRDHLIYRSTLEADQSPTYSLTDQTTIAQIAQRLLVTEDTGKGILLVDVLVAYPGQSMGVERAPGTVVDIDASYGTAFARDSQSSDLFSPGNSVIETQVMFVNVTPGVVTPTITPPNGITCDVGTEPVSVEAAGLTRTNIYCTN